MPNKAAFSAPLMICIMIDAIIAHAVVIGGSAVPALVLLVLAAIVLAAHRDRIVCLIEDQR